MPKAGFEPARPKALDFESSTSANFITSAIDKGYFIISIIKNQSLNTSFCNIFVLRFYSAIYRSIPAATVGIELVLYYIFK